MLYGTLSKKPLGFTMVILNKKGGQKLTALKYESYQQSHLNKFQFHSGAIREC